MIIEKNLKKIIGLIPARLESSRLPNKPLLKILDLTMIIHVAKRAKLSKKLTDVIVCTDSLEIAQECISYGIKCCLTGSYHANGTERIAEAARIIKLTDEDVVIDIQGDEPLIHPTSIDRLIEKFTESESDFDLMLPHIITKEQGNVNIVKIAEVSGRVLFMSRSDIPFNFTQSELLKKHLSIIAFKNKTLQKYSKTPKSHLEKIESIELLRAIETGMNIGTFLETEETFSVDVQTDYERAVRVMRDDKLYEKYK